MARKSKGLGLALSGGAARSIAHIGVLQVLDEAEIPIEAIAATSAGAVIGAARASGTSSARLEEVARKLSWRRIARLAFSRRGLLTMDRLETLIREIVPTDRFEDLPIPLRVTATDLSTGERVVLSSGELVSALLASCAIPGVFLPVERDGRPLVDGGVSCNIPADVCREMGADVVLAVDATAGISRLGEPYNLLQVMVQSVYSMSRHLTRHHLAQADLVVAPEMRGMGWEDLDRAAELIEHGRQHMRRELPKLEKMLARGRLGRILHQWFGSGLGRMSEEP